MLFFTCSFCVTASELFAGSELPVAGSSRNCMNFGTAACRACHELLQLTISKNDQWASDETPTQLVSPAASKNNRCMYRVLRTGCLNLIAHLKGEVADGLAAGVAI